MNESYMVMCNSGGSVFVKTRSYWLSQGGEHEVWGRRWVRVEADSIEDARRLGCEIFKYQARPYENQA